jgi:hypothetical protein
MSRRCAMAATRRAQILMEPEEYRRLEEIARERRVSVAELIRSAVRERYLVRRETPSKAVAGILDMEVELGGWEQVEREISEAHHAPLP